MSKLDWRRSSNGHVQIADSTVTTDDGKALAWYLGGTGNHWGLSLSPLGEPAVKRILGNSSEQAAKDAAQQFETDNAGQAVHFPRFDVLERYHLTSGETIDRVAGPRTEPAYLGELHSEYARPAAKRLRRAQKKRKTLRLFTQTGMALVPANHVVLPGDRAARRDRRRVPGPARLAAAHLR